ncbi:hypothetical protein CIC46_10220 [Listeria monocytogenes]|nr:hypothetical protein [Listeria monocytogenes]
MTTTQQNTNLLLLQNLKDCFEKNKHCFSRSARQTFIHEYGHMKTALTAGFQFTALMVRDPIFAAKMKTKYHLFFYKNHTICYGSCTKWTFCPLSKGCSYFYDPTLCKENTPLTAEDIIHWKQIVLGGLYEELLYGNEHFCKIAGGFGAKLRKRPGKKSKSDYSLLEKIKENPDYCKEINRDFFEIHQYLYDQLSTNPSSRKILHTLKTLIN